MNKLGNAMISWAHERASNSGSLFFSLLFTFVCELLVTLPSLAEAAPFSQSRHCVDL